MQYKHNWSNILNYDFGKYVLKQEGNVSLALVTLHEVQQQEIFQRKFSGTCIFPVTQLYLYHNFKGKINVAFWNEQRIENQLDVSLWLSKYQPRLPAKSKCRMYWELESRPGSSNRQAASATRKLDFLKVP